MKKRWIISAAAFALVAAGAMFTYQWLKPYPVPDIDETVPVAKYNTDFSKERELMKTGAAQQKASKAFAAKPEQVTKANALEAYFYALQLWAGNAGGKADAIVYLKAAVKADPDNAVFSNTLRMYMAELSQSEPFIQYIDSIQAGSSSLKLQKALAYVDQLQNRDLGTASLGQKSAQSIAVLNELLEEHPYDVLAHYARGINNLYWPHGLKKTDKAVQDLAYCLAVAKLDHDRDFPFWPFVYEAYGDALIKNGDIRAGMAVWKEGASRYPKHAGLQERAGAANQQQAHEIVKRIRGIDLFQRPDPDIADLSILWKPESEK